MKQILENLNITKLNEMQNAVIHEFLESTKDIVVLSPTGTGKTLAYLLPSQKLLNRAEENVQMLVLTPGRELTLQSYEVFQKMKCGLKAVACYGGRPTMDEHRTIRSVQPQVIFATPGRLLDHLEKGNIEAGSVTLLVIDEFDKCLEMGFMREMQSILAFLSRDTRRVLLSATDIDSIPRFVNMQRKVKLDFLPKDNNISERVTNYIVKSEDKDKLPALARLLSEKGTESSIVFLNYRDAVERTADYLRQQGFAISLFHGGLEQGDREQSLYLFTNGSHNIMVCTDLAARGLDIPSISNVIHYHLPLSEEEMVHRVGRTARWDVTGNTFFLLGPEETMPAFVKAELEEYTIRMESIIPTPPQMATIYIGKGKKDKISKGDILGFLCKIGGLDGRDIGRIDVYDRYAYVAILRQKSKSLLRNVAGQKIKGMKTVIEPCK